MARKIHISLVGAQREPVYNGIRQTVPDMVVLVHSERTEADAKAVQNMFADTGTDFTLIKMKATQYSVIMATALEIKAIVKPDENEVSLNLVGGTKFWALAFFDVFRDTSANIMLISQNGIVTDLRSMQETVLDESLDLDTHFRLQGNPLTQFTPFDEYTEDDYRSVKTIERAFKFNYGQLKEMTMNQNYLPASGSIDGRYGSYVEWANSHDVTIKLTQKVREETFVLSSEHALKLLFNFNWFEYKVARMLSHWPRSREIWCNCIFQPVKNIDANKVKNEVDIILKAGNKVFFIECKTSIYNSTDIDKFKAVTDNYGSMSSKAVFVTNADIDDTAREKFHDHKIIHFSLEAAGPNKEQELFQMLNKEIDTINA